MPRAAVLRLARAAAAKPSTAPAADLHHRRAGARVRPDDAGDPLLRRLRPARAGARRPQSHLHRARPGAPDADPARQAARPEAGRGQGAGRHVRGPARQPRRSCAASSTCWRASAPSSRRAWPICAPRSTRSWRRKRRPGGSCGHEASDRDRARVPRRAHRLARVRDRARDARRLRSPLPALSPGERRGQGRFEAADWHGQQQAQAQRIAYYDRRVAEATERLQSEFEAATLPMEVWQQVKLHYIGLLINHYQPELAETFFNSVTTKILHRSLLPQRLHLRPLGGLDRPPRERRAGGAADLSRLLPDQGDAGRDLAPRRHQLPARARVRGPRPRRRRR